LEIFLLIANIATAVVLVPILKRRSESIALGYVAFRVMEIAIIVAGIMSVLSVIKLRQERGGSGASAASLVQPVVGLEPRPGGCTARSPAGRGWGAKPKISRSGTPCIERGL
jgi:hypothetical protein